MTAWDPPGDSDLAAGKPGKPSHVRAIRDLPTALAERASGAPWINRSFGFEILGVEHSDAYLNPDPLNLSSLVFEWAVPEDVTRIEATLIGGGGCGGKGRYEGTTPTGGGGGGGGGAMVRQVLEVEHGEVFAVKLGAAGQSGLIHPSVDIYLDDFEEGDGARTVFGDLVAAGGKRGKDGDIAGGGLGGAGGGAIDGVQPTMHGGKGGAGLSVVPGLLALLGGSGVAFGGRGGNTYCGSGAPRTHTVGEGASLLASTTGATVPGVGGGGGASDGYTSYYGGWGANGVVLLRY
jgi:hypothetical protein